MTLAWIISLFTIIAVLPSDSNGQKLKTDSLYSRLQKAVTTTAKIDIYEALIREYQGSEPQKALVIAASLDSLSIADNNGMGMALADYYRGVNQLLKGNYDSVSYYAKLVIRKSAPQAVKRTEAMGLNLRAVYFWHTGKSDSSIIYHLKALRMRERIKDQAGMGVSYLGLGGLYVSLNKLTEAENLLVKAVDIGRLTANERLVINAMHFLANIYSKQKKYQKALKTDTAALEIAVRLNNQRVISQIYSNMASCFAETGRSRIALIYYYKVLEIDRFFKDEKQIGDTYSNIAGVQYKIGDFRKAIEIGQQAVNLFKKTGFSEGLINVYPILSSSYAKLGDYRKAFETESEFNILQKELFNEKSDRTIAELKTQYETEKKEQQILSLQQKSEIQHLEIEVKNILIAVASILVLVLVIFGYILSNRRKLRARVELQEEINRQQVLAARAIINAEERERGRIAADLHDGIGQMLSATLLNLKQLFEKLAVKGDNKEKADQTMALLTNSYDEMRAISHKLMPEAVVKRGLIAAIKDLAERVSNDRFRITVDSHSSEYPLDNEQEAIVYRVIQEAVTNAVKHADADKLSIQFFNHDDMLTVSIEDNGIGFDMTQEKLFSGIGLSNIRSRIDYLGGTLDIDTAPGKGTVLILSIPLGAR